MLANLVACGAFASAAVPVTPVTVVTTLTTTINVYGGPTKARLIQGAYGYLGMSAVAGYDLDPDEMAMALFQLDGMMAEWLTAFGIDMGYNFPNEETIGTGSDESGVPAAAVAVVQQQLSLRLGPMIGKPVSLNQKYMAESWQNLRMAYTRVPDLHLNSTTIRGRGNRRMAGGYRGPFFQPPCREEVQTFGYPDAATGPG